MADKEKPNFKVVADNRRARFDYEIGETFEAGMMLTGPEVKSLRSGKATVAESYAAVDRNGEVILYNANIPEYLQANRFNHEPKRPRKLLLHAKEIAKLARGVEREGMTIVPLQNLLQRQGPGQDRHRAWARQEAARQARDREDARLEPRQVAADEGSGMTLSAAARWPTFCLPSRQCANPKFRRSAAGGRNIRGSGGAHCPDVRTSGPHLRT